MKTMSLLAVGALALVLPAAAQDAKPQTGTTPRKPSTADERFMKDAAAGGMAEVELGRLAAEKATRPEVKSFGQRMVDDHGKANEELKALAARKNVVLPSEPKPEHKAEKEHLEKLSGAAFDDAYSQHMLKDHQKDVAAFKKESTAGSDADTKAWAAKTLPTLEEHLAQAKALNDKRPAGQ